MACLMDEHAVEAWVSPWCAVNVREFTRATPAPVVADAPRAPQRAAANQQIGVAWPTL